MLAPEREVLDATIDALREKDAVSDRERVEQLIGAYRGSGLAVVGVEATCKAFELGQVDELVITARPETIGGMKHGAGEQQPDRSAEERAADELIEIQTGIKGSQDQTVGFGNAIDVVSSHSSARTRHVLNHDRGIARNILAQVKPRQPRPKIISAAGR